MKKVIETLGDLFILLPLRLVGRLVFEYSVLPMFLAIVGLPLLMLLSIATAMDGQKE